MLGAAGWALGGYRLLSIFAFGGLLLGAAVYWSADRLVTGMLGARELLPAEAPALHSTVERLASRAQVVKPRLYLLPDGFPRALAGGRGGAGSVIALSTGLLAAAPPAELEGVLAHEIAHLRHRDVLLQTVAVVLATGLLELARIGGWLQRALLFALGPVAAACVHLLLSPAREFAADHLAARLCDSPHGLADALLRLDAASDLVEFRQPDDRAALHGEPLRGDSIEDDLFESARERPVGGLEQQVLPHLPVGGEPQILGRGLQGPEDVHLSAGYHRERHACP